MTQIVLLVAVDQGVNLKILRKLHRSDKIKLEQVRDIETLRADIQDHGQPFTIGISIIGGSDMLTNDVGSKVKAMFRKDQNNDYLHIYSAHQVHADYFVTEDKDDFIKNGRREELEKLMPGLKIRTTCEFMDEIGEER